MKKILLLLIAIVLAIVPAFSQIVTVFEEGMNGYAGYRIPAIIKASDGSLIAFAEARKNGKGDTGNIDIVMRKSFDNGRTWEAMKVIWDDADNTCGNPVPVVVGNDIALVATWNLGSDKEKFIEQNSSKDTRRVYVSYSHDNGDNWSEPKEITNKVKKAEWGWYATGPCHGIVKQLNPHKGRINGGKPESYSHLIYSDDGGENWSLGAVTKINGNESSVAELSNGKLMLNMRRSSSADSVRYFAVSNDGGKTFYKEGKANDLIEPRCQGSVLNIENDRGKPSKELIFSNPADAAKRINLSLRVSTNNGKTWSYFKQVYADRSAYSDIVQLDSERVGVLFENGDGKETYRRISFSEVCLNH
jgi:sialidase-1